MDFTTLSNEVALDAHECPAPVIENALRHAVREFCERSEIWTEDLADINLLANTSEYAMTEPAGAVVVRAKKAIYDGTPVPIKTEREMDEEVADWRSETGVGLSAVVSLSRLGVYAYPTPPSDDSNPLTVRAVLKPTLTATECHDDVESYSESIVYGALARLKAMPNKPWSDREAVAAYRAQFNKAMARAYDEAWFGFQADKDMRVIPE